MSGKVTYMKSTVLAGLAATAVAGAPRAYGGYSGQAAYGQQAGYGYQGQYANVSASPSLHGKAPVISKTVGYQGGQVAQGSYGAQAGYGGYGRGLGHGHGVSSVQGAAHSQQYGYGRQGYARPAPKAHYNIGGHGAPTKPVRVAEHAEYGQAAQKSQAYGATAGYGTAGLGHGLGKGVGLGHGIQTGYGAQASYGQQSYGVEAVKAPVAVKEVITIEKAPEAKKEVVEEKIIKPVAVKEAVKVEKVVEPIKPVAIQQVGYGVRTAAPIVKLDSRKDETRGLRSLNLSRGLGYGRRGGYGRTGYGRHGAGYKVVGYGGLGYGRGGYGGLGYGYGGYDSDIVSAVGPGRASTGGSARKPVVVGYNGDRLRDIDGAGYASTGYDASYRRLPTIGHLKSYDAGYNDDYSYGSYGSGYSTQGVGYGYGNSIGKGYGYGRRSYPVLGAGSLGSLDW